MNKPPPLRILVLGPTNVGKSTFVGHFLYRYGDLEPDVMEKLRKQKEEGKSYGQMLSSLHGLKEAIYSKRYYKSPKYEVSIVNPANHPQNVGSFFPNGEQAACVMLLVSVAEGKFEADWALIQSEVCFACSLPLKNIVVWVNKMDSTQPPYSQQRYEEIGGKIFKCFQKFDIEFHNVVFSPLSAVHADHVQMPWLQRCDVMSGGGTGTKTDLLEFLDSISSCQPRREPTDARSDLNRDPECGEPRALDLRVSCPSAGPPDWTRHPGPPTGVRDDHVELPLTRQDRRQGEEAARRAWGQQWARKGMAPREGQGPQPEDRRPGLLQPGAGLRGLVSQPAQSPTRPAPCPLPGPSSLQLPLLPSTGTLFGLSAPVQQGPFPQPEGPLSLFVLEQGASEPSWPKQWVVLQAPEDEQQSPASGRSLPSRWPHQVTLGQPQQRQSSLSPSPSSSATRLQPVMLASRPLPSTGPRSQLGQDPSWHFLGAPSSLSSSSAALGPFPSPLQVVEGPLGASPSPQPLFPAVLLLPAPPAQVVTQAPESMTPPPVPSTRCFLTPLALVQPLPPMLSLPALSRSTAATGSFSPAAPTPLRPSSISCWLGLQANSPLTPPHSCPLVGETSGPFPALHWPDGLWGRTPCFLLSRWVLSR